MRFVFLAAMACAALAQTPAEKPATVSGTVLNSVTGEPLRKADVTLSNGNVTEEAAAMMRQFSKQGDLRGQHVSTKTFAAATDANGKFQFDNIPPGTYWLRVKKTGFGDRNYSADNPDSEDPSSFRLTAGQSMTKVELRLVPNATISGRVVDEDGDPVPDATVGAQVYAFGRGRRELMPADAAQTNARGEFTLGKLPPGSYYLSAAIHNMDLQPKPRPADGTPETAYVRTYFPGATDISQAQKTEVTAGAEVNGLTIQLRKAKVVRISGRLVDAAGAPIKSAQIMLMSGMDVGTMSMKMVNDPEGKFEIGNLQPGSYTAMVMQMEGSSPKMSMIPITIPDDGIDGIKLGPKPDGTIQGSITVDGGAKIPLDGMAISLTPAGSMVMPAGAAANASGAFTLDHVTAATYDVTFPHLPKGTYIKSFTFNGRDTFGQPIDCTGGAAGNLRIVLGTDGGKVEATAKREEQHIANATVVLLPADPARRFPQAVFSASADYAGNAALTDVAPGDYLAFAWQKVEDDIWYDPAYIKKIEDQAVKVKVGAASSQKIELKVLPDPK